METRNGVESYQDSVLCGEETRVVGSIDEDYEYYDVGCQTTTTATTRTNGDDSEFSEGRQPWLRYWENEEVEDDIFVAAIGPLVVVRRVPTFERCLQGGSRIREHEL